MSTALWILIHRSCVFYLYPQAQRTCCSDPILGGSIFPCHTVVLLICSILSHLFVNLSVLLTCELPFYSICRKAWAFIWILLASRFSSAQIQWLIHVGYSLKPQKCVCAHLCPTLCNPIDYTPPCHGIFQARTLVLSQGSKPASVLPPALAGRFLNSSATWESAPRSYGIESPASGGGLGHWRQAQK